MGSKRITVISNKHWGVLLLLSIFLGGLGIDRFYLGKIGTGILKLVLCMFCIGFIWYVIDIILIVTNTIKDSEGRELIRGF